MIFLSFAFIYLGGLAAIVYLVSDGHPWFALFVLIWVGCISMPRGGDNKKNKQ